MKVAIAGATGWTGGCVARSILSGKVSGFEIQGAVARQAQGQDLGLALGCPEAGVMIQRRVEDALEGVDVLIDYTHPSVVKQHTLTALQHARQAEAREPDGGVEIDPAAVAEARRMVTTFAASGTVPQPLLECIIFRARYFRDTLLPALLHFEPTTDAVSAPAAPFAA